MQSCVAFLRAINTGRRRVKMDVLRELAAGVADLHDVGTLLASGNVVFRTAAAPDAALEQRLEEAFSAGLGFASETFIRTADELRAITASPLRARDVLPGSALEIGFLRTAPTAAEAAAVAALSTPQEWVLVHGRELWWRRVPGQRSAIGGSHIDRAIRGPVTIRSITTVERLVERTR